MKGLQLSLRDVSYAHWFLECGMCYETIIIFLSWLGVWQAHQVVNKHHNKQKQIDMFWRRCYSGNGETQPSGAFVSDMVMVWNSWYLCCFFNTVFLTQILAFDLRICCLEWRWDCECLTHAKGNKWTHCRLNLSLIDHKRKVKQSHSTVVRYQVYSKKNKKFFFF